MTTRSKPNITISPGTAADIDAAAQSLCNAFANDPLMNYFFGGHSDGSDWAITRFFTLLMQARVALGMPVMLAKQGDEIVGAVMGYTTERPAWPQEIDKEWAAFEATSKDIPVRFDAYEAIADTWLPPGPHYYLGVIGVHPASRGTGVGKMLLDEFCRLSSRDENSTGVYLETSNPDSLAFYQRSGFHALGEGDLEGTRLWCVFQPR